MTDITGRWTLEDRFESPWHYLPVEAGAGATGLRVELSYDRAGGAVLDLGCFGPHGFRGWSGGARESFVIGRDAATPGYLPGEIEAGTWQVAIGTHRIPPDGVPYRVRTEVIRSGDLHLPPAPSPAPALAGRPAPRVLPARPGYRWLAGDLHTHTVHSDGVLTVSELAVLAVERGLDFLAITDHNTISHHPELAAASARYGITLVPGQEVTTDRGHAGALGDIGWVDFRREPDDWLDATEAGGGLLSINHPFAGDVSWVHPMRRRPPLLEVWHWSWLDPRWTTPLSWWQAWDPTAIPVGGSDWHRAGNDAPPGRPTTWVQCTGVMPADVIDGLRAGRVAISAERDGPVLLRDDGELVAVDADGLTLAGPQGPCARVRGDVARLDVDRLGLDRPGLGRLGLGRLGLGRLGGPYRLLDAGGGTLALTA